MRDNHASEKTFARRSDGSLPGHVLGLNLEPSDDPAEAPNGVLLELSEEDLERLDVRELRYDRFALGEDVERPRTSTRSSPTAPSRPTTRRGRPATRS